MAEWWKLQHSHEYNILGAVFENKENVIEEVVVAIATNVAIPFNMQILETNSKCETFAKILFFVCVGGKKLTLINANYRIVLKC